MLSRICTLAITLFAPGLLFAQLVVKDDALHLHASQVGYINVLANDSNAAGIAPAVQVITQGQNIQLSSVVDAPRMLRVTRLAGAPASGQEDLTIGVVAGSQSASSILRVCWGDVAECGFGVINDPGPGTTQCYQGLCVYVDGTLASGSVSPNVVPPTPLFPARPAGETSEAAIKLVYKEQGTLTIGPSGTTASIRFENLNGTAFTGATLSQNQELQLKLKATHAAGLVNHNLEIKSFGIVMSRFTVSADVTTPTPSQCPNGFCVYVNGTLSSTSTGDVQPPTPLFPARPAGETSEAAIKFVYTSSGTLTFGPSGATANIRLEHLNGTAFTGATLSQGQELQLKLKATHAAGLVNHKLEIKSFGLVMSRFTVSADASQPASQCALGLCIYVNGTLSSSSTGDVLPPTPLFPAQPAGATSEAAIKLVYTEQGPLFFGPAGTTTNIRLEHLDGTVYTGQQMSQGQELQLKLKATHAAGLINHKLEIKSFGIVAGRFTVSADASDSPSPSQCFFGLCVYVDGTLASSSDSPDVTPPAPLFPARPAGETSEAAIKLVYIGDATLGLSPGGTTADIRLEKLDGASFTGVTMSHGQELNLKLKATHKAGLTGHYLELSSLGAPYASFHIDADTESAPAPQTVLVPIRVGKILILVPTEKL